MVEKVVISYGDSILRESDVKLLCGPYWLSDNIISFYFEYLTGEVFKMRSDILFIGPEVTHCLKASKTSNELSVFLNPLNALEKDLVFFAFNDNRQFSESGGTHWSLLTYCKKIETFYHIDSIKGSNVREADRFAGNLLKYFTPNGKGEFIDLDCLQQNNSYDCGIFVMANAKCLADEWVNTSRVSSGDYQICLEIITNMRQEMLEIIDKLK